MSRELASRYRRAFRSIVSKILTLSLLLWVRKLSVGLPAAEDTPDGVVAPHV